MFGVGTSYFSKSSSKPEAKPFCLNEQEKIGRMEKEAAFALIYKHRQQLCGKSVPLKACVNPHYS
jgi:hypothetical protein